MQRRAGGVEQIIVEINQTFRHSTPRPKEIYTPCIRHIGHLLAKSVVGAWPYPRSVRAEHLILIQEPHGIEEKYSSCPC
jgi:hypothetical protein